MTANTLFRRGAGLLSGALAILASSMVYAAPQPESGIGLPRDISVEGHRIDWLIRVTGLFVTILFVIMCIWMLMAVIKHNKNHEAEYDHGNARHQVRFAAGLSAVIFFVVDGNLWVNSTVDVTSTFWNFEKAEKTPGAVRIEINAHQWAWDARYPGPDGKFNTADDVVTLNDIRIPVNTPVVFQIAAADVIHSFWIPNMRIKQDAMPGMINRMWISAKEVGQVDIACTQHCGTNHYKMKGTLTVLTAEEYAKWIAEASANGARSYNPDDKDSHWGWDWRVN